jgi:large subunit ribosomal protein L4
MQIKVYNQTAEAIKDLEVSSKAYGLKPNNELLQQAVVAQRANQRQVLAHTKDRSEVAGTGKKPWKQKGTGRARAGSRRSPIWIGGGVTFGPTKDRNFKLKINQKMKQKAMFMALSDKVATGTMLVLDELSADSFKTKKFSSLLGAFETKVLKNDRRDILIINEGKDEKVYYSLRNLAGVKVINLENINLLDLLAHRNLLLTEQAVKILEQRIANS